MNLPQLRQLTGLDWIRRGQHIRSIADPSHTGRITSAGHNRRTVRVRWNTQRLQDAGRPTCINNITPL